jgi:hypothetical protein
MANAVVSESALRELLSEALENDGAMGYDAEPPIVPNAATDRTTLQLDADPVELRHVPRTKNELIIMVRNLLDDVPDDQSGELYKKIRDVFAGDDTGTRDFAGGHEVKNNVTPDINQARNLQRNPNKMENKKSISSVIKSIVEDAMSGMSMSAHPSAGASPPASADDDLDEADPTHPNEKRKKVNLAGSVYDPDDPEHMEDPDAPKFFRDDGGEEGPFGDDELSDSAWDPELPDGDDDDDDDEEGSEKGKRKSRAGLEIGAYGVDGITLEKIGEELGFTKEAAKKAIETAMERFKVLHEMEPEDRDELVLVGVSDYINMLGKTGEMTEEEEEFMRLHPKVVAMSDNFRDFFSKYVKRATREMRADTQDDTEL